MPDTSAPQTKLEAGQYTLVDALVLAITACHKAYKTSWDEIEKAVAAEPGRPHDDAGN